MSIDAQPQPPYNCRISLGAHSLGFAHCSSFEGRLRNFDSTDDVDASMRPSFAASMKRMCPVKGRARNAGVTMDPSPMSFDNTYYRVVLQGKGLFSIDQALLTHPKTKRLVTRFATSRKAFVDTFVHSIVKLSSVTGGQEIRRNCRVVNCFQAPCDYFYGPNRFFIWPIS
ncbi:hypothetical protein SAY87_017224 [Trapa incisa]|uniref:peroxidase n=1 Tax=Trapa incisa TaxID=236973 RepID=A0AAN7LDS0_9MYRT|nr:hypothetical protein SAY87_017224 [Trapa incisa]